MKKSLAPRSFSEVGFTLIEILVVVTIIMLLTATAAVSYSQFLKTSRDAKRKADLGQISVALEMLRSNNDIYTAYAAGNCASYTALTGTPKYIQSMPSDPKSTYNYYCSISTGDYTLGAYLESGSGSCGGSCGGSACNYCVGPYGQIYP